MKKIPFIVIFVFTLLASAQSNLPNTPLKKLYGGTTSLQEIAKENDLIVVSLWATWCQPCKNELDAISDVYSNWQEETNLILYAISIDDSRTIKRVKPLVNGKDWDFEILLDTNNDLKRALGAATVPKTLIIKNGEIVYKHSGYTPGYENELYKEIKNYL